MEEFEDAAGLLLERSPQTTYVPSPESLPACPPPPTPTDATKYIKENKDTQRSAENGSPLDQKVCLSSEALIQHGVPLNGKIPVSSERSNGRGVVSESDTILSPAVDNVLYPNTSQDQSSPISLKSSNVSEVDTDKYATFPSEDHSRPGSHALQTSPISLEVPNELGTEMENAPDVLLDLHSVSCSPLDQVTSLSAGVANEVNTVTLSHQREEGCSDRLVEVNGTGDLTASDEIRKTEKPANELNHYRVDVRSTQNESTEQANSSGHVKQPEINRGIVDTAAPFESVKEAVSKFGGIVDWKAHRAHTMERRKQVQLELESIREEIPTYKKQAEAAEEVKVQVVEELDNMKRLIEELKLNLERAQIEESQAKQDSELVLLRVKEVEEGIAEEASIAAKTQLEVAKTRHEAAISELKSVKKELEEVQGNFLSVLNERDAAIRSAEVAVSTTKEIEKTVEDLTLELIALKESVESAHAAHLEAEEHRIGAALARDQDCLNWERELKQAKEKLQRENEEILSSEVVKEKLEKESTLLLCLQSELAAYMEARLNQESHNNEEEKGSKTHEDLEEIKVTIEKAKNEVNILRVASSTFKSELEKERSGLASMRQREGMASIAVSSLEAEIERTKEEIKVVLTKEKEAREQIVELPKLLQLAAHEADQAKSGAQLARDELRKAKEEAEQANATASTTQTRLHAALKEIEAAKASEKLALLAIKSLQGSGGEDFTDGVTLPVEEYYSLSKKAYEAEQLSNEKVTSAMAEIEVAKESELKSLERLEEAYRMMNGRKETLRVAKERAEKAKEGKLGVEQELRKWRSDHEQRRRASDAAQSGSNPSKSPPRKVRDENMSSGKDPAAYLHPEPNAKVYTTANQSENHIPEAKKPKKKSLFPRLVTKLLARKKGSINVN